MKVNRKGLCTGILTLLSLLLVWTSLSVSCYAKSDTETVVDNENRTNIEKSDVVEHPRILFLSSYAYDWESIPRQLKGISSVLNGKAKIDYIFMDTKKVPLEKVEKQILRHIQYNLQKEGAYDVVILGDDAALDFGVKYQTRLFRGVPLVFEGINTQAKAMEAAKDPYISGIAEQFPLEDTIQLANELYPDARQIVAISDNSESGKGSTEQYYDCKSFFPNLQFKDINTSLLTKSQLQEQVSQYGTETILLYLMGGDDVDGNNYTLLESVELVTSSAKIPIFKADEVGVGYGLIGGITISFENMASTAAQMALDIINGESISNIPVTTTTQYTLFDYQVMQKYGIKKSRIPYNAVLINYQPTLYETHRVLVLTTVGIVFFLLFGVVFLIWENRRRALLLQHIKESDEKLSLVVEIAKLYSWEYDIHQHCVIYDEHMMKDLSIPKVMENYPSSIIELGLIHADSIQDYREMHERLKRGVKEVTKDIKMNRKDGVNFWLRITYSLVENTMGEETKAIATAIEVTEQHQLYERYGTALAAHSLLEGHAEVNMTLDISEDMLLDYDYTSEQFVDVIPGDSVSQVLEAVSVDIDKAYQHEFQQNFSLDNLKRAYSQGTTMVSLEYRRKWENKNIWMRTVCNLLEHPETAHIIAFVTTQDIHFEKILSLSLNRIIEKNVDFASVVEMETRRSIVLSAKMEDTCLPNEKVYDYETCVKRSIQLTVYPEDRELCTKEFDLSYIVEKLKDKKEHIILFRMISQEEQVCWKKMRIFYLDERQEEIIMVRTDVTDVYEKEKGQQEKLREALRVADRANAAKSEFLSNMSHEIRTPLNAIIGMAKLAEDNQSNQQEIAKYVQQIDISSQYLLGIINDILDMSRIEQGKLVLHPEWTYINEIIPPCIAMMEPMMQAKNIRFTYSLQEEDFTCFQVYADSLRLKQIIMNLLNNAYKFTDNGGTIDFSSKTITRGEGQCIREYRISDNGCGMGSEFLEKAFAPFEQEQSSYSNALQGTGLGLALVKKLIDIMEGKISISSEPEKGTTVIICLAYEYRKRKPDKEKEDFSLESLEGAKVLLTEDNEINIAVAEKLLQSRGIQVDVAINGKLAVDKFKESAIHSYDAILMDIRMDVMDGLEATKQIRALKREDAKCVPIIAMSANAFEEDIQKSMAAGMNAYLMKPIDPQKMFRTLAIQMHTCLEV